MVYTLSTQYAAFALAHVLIVCALVAKMRFTLLGRVTRRHFALVWVIIAVGVFEFLRALGFFFYGSGGTGHIQWNPAFIRILWFALFRTTVTSVISFLVILLVIHLINQNARYRLAQYALATAVAFCYYLGRKILQRYLFSSLGAADIPISGHALVLVIDYFMPILEISALLMIRYSLKGIKKRGVAQVLLRRS